MNPIPFTWCLAGAGATFVLGGLAGWTIRDWKRDSEVLAEVTKAAKNLDKASAEVAKAAGAYEQEKADAVTNTTLRESTIREVYRNVPVDADCAAPDAAARVLNDAVAAANARASGQPATAVPGPASTP